MLIHIHTPQRTRTVDTARVRQLDALTTALTRRVLDAEFEENEHPRGPDGKFTAGAGTGPKPTSHTAKSIKGGLHQLLSTGHPFSIEELQQATRVKSPAMMAAYLSDLKNPKYAPKEGHLAVVKRSDGLYHVAQEAAITKAAPTPAPKPDVTVPTVLRVTRDPSEGTQHWVKLPGDDREFPLSRADATFGLGTVWAPGVGGAWDDYSMGPAPSQNGYISQSNLGETKEEALRYLPDLVKRLDASPHYSSKAKLGSPVTVKPLSASTKFPAEMGAGERAAYEQENEDRYAKGWKTREPVKQPEVKADPFQALEQQAHRDLVPIQHVFKSAFADPPLKGTRVEGFKPHDTKVSVSDIIPTQSHVHLEGLKAYHASGNKRDTRGNQLPEVIKKGDKYYMLDGHHRTGAQILGGASHVDVHVMSEQQAAGVKKAPEAPKLEWNKSNDWQQRETAKLSTGLVAARSQRENGDTHYSVTKPGEQDKHFIHADSDGNVLVHRLPTPVDANNLDKGTSTRGLNPNQAAKFKVIHRALGVTFANKD